MFKKCKKLVLLAACVILGSLSMGVSASEFYLSVEQDAPKVNVVSSKAAYVPVKQTVNPYGSGKGVTFTFNLKAVKGRKITGTATAPKNTVYGRVRKLNFNYNAKGALTSYDVSYQGESMKYYLQGGEWSKITTTTSSGKGTTTYKMSNKKYSGKTLKSATVTVYENGEKCYRYNKTYYTSGRAKGLVKSSKCYGLYDGKKEYIQTSTYTYSVDSHGNVTSSKETTKSAYDSNPMTVKYTTSYKKIALK